MFANISHIGETNSNNQIYTVKNQLMHAVLMQIYIVLCLSLNVIVLLAIC